MKGMYHYLRQAWKKPDNETLKHRMIAWRQSEAAVVVDKPLRLDRARALGYKAKKGFIVVRIRVIRGGRKREQQGIKGRVSRKQYIRKILKMSYQWVAEIRAEKKFPNLMVLNSYLIGKDGKHAFYEVIMIDPHRPEIMHDASLQWTAHAHNRAQRGLTSAGKRSRGLYSRNRKVRPSLRAHHRQGK